jgi:hypothetical protein
MYHFPLAGSGSLDLCKELVVEAISTSLSTLLLSRTFRGGFDSEQQPQIPRHPVQQQLPRSAPGDLCSVLVQN